MSVKCQCKVCNFLIYIILILVASALELKELDYSYGHYSSFYKCEGCSESKFTLGVFQVLYFSALIRTVQI